jgi:hypothetical protein
LGPYWPIPLSACAWLLCLAAPRYGSDDPGKMRYHLDRRSGLRVDFGEVYGDD